MNAISPIRVLAVDDHPMVRQGVAGLVKMQPDMILVGKRPMAARLSSYSGCTVRTLR